MWKKILHSDNFLLYMGLTIVLVSSSFAWKESADATHHIDKKFCSIAVPSWIIRNELIHEINEPSTLSKLIDANSPEGKALQAQVDKNNKLKTERLAKDLKTNGPKPC